MTDPLRCCRPAGAFQRAPPPPNLPRDNRRDRPPTIARIFSKFVFRTIVRIPMNIDENTSWCVTASENWHPITPPLPENPTSRTLRYRRAKARASGRASNPTSPTPSRASGRTGAPTARTGVAVYRPEGPCPFGIERLSDPLNADDLMTSPAFVVRSAGNTFQHPTRRPNERWQTDCTYLHIVGWGWYSLSTVLDDDSRDILRGGSTRRCRRPTSWSHWTWPGGDGP